MAALPTLFLLPLFLLLPASGHGEPAVVLNSYPPGFTSTFFQEHRTYFLAAGGIIFALSGIILLLLAANSARRRAESEMRRKSALLQTIIDALPAPVYYKDEKGRYLGCNEAFERFLGKDREEIVGRSVFDIAPRDLAEIYHRADQEVFTRGGTQAYETAVVYADGTRREVLFHKAVFPGENGSAGGLVGAMLDITERRQREREMEALAAMATALRTVRSSEEMYPLLTDRLTELAKVSGAFLLVCHSESGELNVERGSGACAALTGLTIPAAAKEAHRLFSEGRPFVSGRDGSFTIPLPAGVEHLAAFPMIAHDQVIGALCASRHDPFPPEELRLLASVAETGAASIHRATLHERTEQQVKRLSALQSIDRAIIGSHDFGLTLDTLLEQVLGELRVDAADVLLLKSHTETLEFAAGRGFRTAHIRSTRLRPGEGVAGGIVRDRRLVCLPDIMNEGGKFVRAEMAREEGFVSYYGVPLIARGECLGVLELFHRCVHRPQGDWLEFLETLGTQAAIALDNALLFEGLQRSNAELTRAYDRTIEGWSRVLDLRDRETEGHSRRVMEMTVRLAREMGIGEGEMVHLRRGALLHDIGKMGIPDAVLLKPGKLTEEEWAVMKTHPRLAHDFLSPIDYLRPALDIPYCHHEKWNGSGYPRGLQGEQIPLAARIFAVVDVWDALSSDRPYRPAWKDEEVRRYIGEEAGRHFDPRVAEAFLVSL